MTLLEFNQFFPEFYKLCPNTKTIMFSTNGVAFADRIIAFVKMLKQTVKNNLFTFELQFSYDGYKNTKEKRGADPERIKNNVKTFLTELNNIELPDTFNIQINFHNVIDDSIINLYADDKNADELKVYIEELIELENEFMNLNTNPQVDVSNFSPGIISPLNASVQDGKNLVKFFNNCEKIGEHCDNKFWRGLAHLSVLGPIRFDYETDGKKLIKSLLNGDLKEQEIARLSSMCGCGYGYGALKIRYDGTLAHCQNGALMGLTDEELEGQDGLVYEVQKAKIKHGFYPNVFSSSDEELDRYLYLSYLNSRDSFPHLFLQSLNLMIMLLSVHQIDQSYNDVDKLLRHAYYMAFVGSCPHNNMTETGSVVRRSVGWFRFLCNGFLDICEEYLPIWRERDREAREHECNFRR